MEKARIEQRQSNAKGKKLSNKGKGCWFCSFVVLVLFVMVAESTVVVVPFQSSMLVA